MRLALLRSVNSGKKPASSLEQKAYGTALRLLIGQNMPPRATWPDASALQFVFRAITPPGRPRRFDARFFLIDAEALHGDIDDFSNASDELSHLQWIALEDVRKFDLPFITEGRACRSRRAQLKRSNARQRADVPQHRRRKPVPAPRRQLPARTRSQTLIASLVLKYLG